jgi:hypothetical protein
MRASVIGSLGILLPVLLSAQELQVVRGTVRNPGGTPLEGADVLLDARLTRTNAQGAFRIDSVAPGSHYLTVRLAGYVPIRAQIEVDPKRPADLAYTLTPAPFLLPPVVTTLSRSGIYGAVGDTTRHPLAGVRVEAAGVNGGVVRTDSLGGFAFPAADRGVYLLRITHPGYAERRFSLELSPGEGRQVVAVLTPSRRPASRADDLAFESLHKRLAFGRRRERMAPSELERYGAQGLCDIPRVAAELGRSEASTTVILNGVTALLAFPVNSLCAWRADEVSLVEFGKDICADVTQTAGQALPVPSWCAGRTRNVPRSMGGSTGRIRGQPGGSSYIIIWERR